MVPPDATVGADLAHLEAVGILARWPLVGHGTWGGFIAGGGGAHVERLMRPRLVELVAAVGELLLLDATVGLQEGGWFRLSACEACARDDHSVGVYRVRCTPARCPGAPTTRTTGTAGPGCGWRTVRRGRYGYAAAGRMR
jgi:hypothetical protein